MGKWSFFSSRMTRMTEAASRRPGRSTRGRRLIGDVRPSNLFAAEVLESKRPFAIDILAPIADESVMSVAGNTVSVDLTGRFDIQEVRGSVVAFETNAPVGSRTFYAELFDQPTAFASRTTPVTVGNFLSYVNAGDYDGTIIHRSITSPVPFVLQGGGYIGPTAASNAPSDNVPFPVATRGAIANEPGNANVRGTLAMAKVDGQVNSATSQWFVNLSDNADLNSANGGFTVFGRVLGESGLSAIDTMALALDYDARPLYGDQALRNLPLWQLDSDMIVRPNDFLRIESVSKLANETGLMTYSVASSNTAVATVAITGGRVVVTPRQGAAGPVTITVTARSALDNASRSDDFVVTVRAMPTYTTLDSFGATTLRRQDGTGLLFAGEVPVFVGTSQASEVTYSSHEFLGAEAVGGVNTILIRRKSTGAYGLWKLDSTWKHQSSTSLPTDKTQLMAVEVAFNRDIDGDGDVGLVLTPIESAGQVALSVNKRGELFANTTPVMVSGLPASVSRFSRVTFVGAEAIGGVNTILFKNGTTFGTWQLNASWVHQATPTLTPSAIPAIETGFGVDINSDSHIGARQSVIESIGLVSLEKDAAGALFAAGMPVMVGGTPATVGRYSSFTFLGAEAVGGKNTILVRRNDTGALRLWHLNASWAHESSPAMPTAPVELARLESAFRIDVNGDGQARELIEAVGSIPLVKNAAGELFAWQTPVMVGGLPASTGRYSSFAFLGAEQIGGVNTILVRRISTGAYSTWQLDSSWAHKASVAAPTEPALLAPIEFAFQVDVDGSGQISGGLTTIESVGAVTLVSNASGELLANNVIVRVAGTPATISRYSSVFFLGAERVNGVNTILSRKKTTGEYGLWQLDDTWNHVKSLGLPTDQASLTALQQAFATSFTG